MRGDQSDLPAGYRWAEWDEVDRADAIVVQRSFDSNGRLYVQGEADVAVPANDDAKEDV